MNIEHHDNNFSWKDYYDNEKPKSMSMNLILYNYNYRCNLKETIKEICEEYLNHKNHFYTVIRDKIISDLINGIIINKDLHLNIISTEFFDPHGLANSFLNKTQSKDYKIKVNLCK